ncbi:MAG: FecR family protein [Niabella sp.]|nr:FecR family protein [Niabella sp.]
MEINEALIQRFFNKQCSAEEATLVSAFLERHPEVLEQYAGKAEWDLDDSVPLPDGTAFDSMWRRITLRRKGAQFFRGWLKKAVAAAALVGGIALGYRVVHLPGGHSVASGAGGAAGSGDTWISLQNDKKETEIYRLPDSSLVTLYPKSAITYNQKQFNAERNLSLKGQAVFEVKASKTRPFTVYSNNVYTTALGTRFRVKAYDSLHYVRVHLYRGKVHIALRKAAAGAPNSYYMMPGNVLYFDCINGWATLSGNGHSSAGGQQHAAPEERSLSNWYAFENRDMAEVFDELSAIYNVKIIYDSETIQGQNFIGRIEKQAPLERILSDIALVNDLKVTKKNGSYIISKK